MANGHPSITLESPHVGAEAAIPSPNVLVILTGTMADHRIVAEAGHFVAGTGGRLVLLRVLSPREFSDRQRAYAQLEILPWYSRDQAEEAGRLAADRVGYGALSDLDVEYTAVGSVGREVEQALLTARAYDCGHVFLLKRPRSMLRRLFVRDPAQTIARQFDGFVTVGRPDREPVSTIEPPAPTAD
jgi:hypothetical protein